MSREEMENRQRYAAEEMFNMRQRASMPPVPPFVRMSGNNSGGNSAGNRQPHNTNEPQNSGEPTHSVPNPAEPEPPPKKGFGGLLGKDILKFIDLKNFELDSDRMLLLLMILLLSGENSDNTLLFALAYIML